jgi:hypothetical protein
MVGVDAARGGSVRPVLAGALGAGATEPNFITLPAAGQATPAAKGVVRPPYRQQEINVRPSCVYLTVNAAGLVGRQWANWLEYQSGTVSAG